MSALPERLRQVDDRVWDRALVVLLAFLMVVSILGSTGLEGSRALNLAVGLAMTLPLLARRTHPIATATAGCRHGARRARLPYVPARARPRRVRDHRLRVLDRRPRGRSLALAPAWRSPRGRF